MNDLPTLLTASELTDLGFNPNNYTPVAFYFPDCAKKRATAEPLYRSSDLFAVPQPRFRTLAIKP